MLHLVIGIIMLAIVLEGCQTWQLTLHLGIDLEIILEKLAL